MKAKKQCCLLLKYDILWKKGRFLSSFALAGIKEFSEKAKKGDEAITTYMYIYASTSIYLYMYVYIYIYTKTYILAFQLAFL